MMRSAKTSKRRYLLTRVEYFEEQQKLKIERIHKYYEAPKHCDGCGKPLSYEKRSNRFCSQTCSAKVTNKERGPHSQETKDRLARACHRQRSIEGWSSYFSSFEHNRTPEANKRRGEGVRRFYAKHPEAHATMVERCRISAIRAMTPERRAKLSALAKERGFGGRIFSRRIYYETPSGKSVCLQSTYEESLAKSLDDAEINWPRPEPLLWIDETGKQHNYFPDFYLPDFDVYLDPKNEFILARDRPKIARVRKQNHVAVIILSKSN